MSAWPLYWWAVAAVATVAIAAAYRARFDRVDLALAGAIPLGAGVALAQIFGRIALGPLDAWNAGRVATSIAFARGFDIYPTRESGAVLDFMYGPMAAIVYAPAAFASTPSGAIYIGVAASLLFAVLPFAWYVSRTFAADQRMLGAAAVTSFCLLCASDAGLAIAAWSIHADAPAMALAGLAFAALLVGGERASNRTLFFVAVIAALAVWSKQIAAPIVLAIPGWVWLCRGRDEALRCTLWLGAIGFTISLAFVAYFGFEGIFFNMFRIPSGHPWKPASSKLAALTLSFSLLVWTARLPLALIAGAVLLTRRKGRSLRDRFREQPWLGFVWAGLWMTPTAALGQVKLGGSFSSFGMTTWFLAAAGIAGVATLAATKPAPAAPGPMRSATAARLTLVALLTLPFVLELSDDARRRSFDTAFFEIRHIADNPQEQAVAFARAHPGEVLFASNPLIGLYSDGVLYHSLKGFLDRIASGIEAPGPELMRAHIPPRLRYVAMRTSHQPQRFRHPEAFFPGFRVPLRPERLDHHVVWTRSDSPAGPRSP